MEYGCKPAGQTRAASPHIAAIQPTCVKRRYAACQRGPTAPRSPQKGEEVQPHSTWFPLHLTSRMRRRRHPLRRRRSRHSRHCGWLPADPPLSSAADPQFPCPIPPRRQRIRRFLIQSPLSSPSSLPTPTARTGHLVSSTKFIGTRSWPVRVATGKIVFLIYVVVYIIYIYFT